MPTALIVEDEPEANELLAMLVQLRGHQTCSAATGAEALAKAEQVRPDLVFLDLMLPDINGFEVCRSLRSGRSTCAIPVVMVTARIAAENRVEGFRLGATDYVAKPYTPDQIFEAMAQADAWSCRLAREGTSGTISFDARDDVGHFRDISRLWTLLLERTPLPEADAQGIDRALVALAGRAVAWGRARGVGLVASLRYEWNERGVVLTLEDQSGWLRDDCFGKTDELIACGHFDEFATDEATHQVVMTRWFDPDEGRKAEDRT